MEKEEVYPLMDKLYNAAITTRPDLKISLREVVQRHDWDDQNRNGYKNLRKGTIESIISLEWDFRWTYTPFGRKKYPDWSLQIMFEMKTGLILSAYSKANNIHEGVDEAIEKLRIGDIQRIDHKYVILKEGRYMLNMHS